MAAEESPSEQDTSALPAAGKYVIVYCVLGNEDVLSFASYMSAATWRPSSTTEKPPEVSQRSFLQRPTITLRVTNRLKWRNIGAIRRGLGDFLEGDRASDAAGGSAEAKAAAEGLSLEAWAAEAR